MVTPMQCMEKIKEKITAPAKCAFFSAFFVGVLVHLPMLLSDIPNHDGLDSMYFDQNMITSGRWLLTVACGFSSYFSLPWVTGMLAMFFLALAAAALVMVLEVENKLTVFAISALFAVFPAVASTFAYVYTMDGYMIALFLAVLSVLFTKQYQKGFLAGAVCLGCSLGIYQSYLPFAVLLSMYMVVIICMSEDSTAAKAKKILHYLYMGVGGACFYMIMLRLLLLIQGKELANYQGIDAGIGSAANPQMSFVQRLVSVYRDFVAFSVKGHVVFNNVYSAGAVLLLVISLVILLGTMCVCRKWWKSPWFFAIIIVLILGVPVASNLILIISPQVTYHLLMRYHWVLFLIFTIAFMDRYASERQSFLHWMTLVSVIVLLLNYAVTDNIAYSNLQKKYEKTYAYCLRLLDRVEQTPGYYPGIPVAMIGVVSDEQYPKTDITGAVTDPMIGMNGDMLLYTGANYEAFYRYYLGASLNILEPEAMSEMYYADVYKEMDSFPGEHSIKIIDGILYIKTENVNRD